MLPIILLCALALAAPAYKQADKTSKKSFSIVQSIKKVVDVVIDHPKTTKKVIQEMKSHPDQTKKITLGAVANKDDITNVFKAYNDHKATRK